MLSAKHAMATLSLTLLVWSCGKTDRNASRNEAAGEASGGSGESGGSNASSGAGDSGGTGHGGQASGEGGSSNTDFDAFVEAATHAYCERLFRCHEADQNLLAQRLVLETAAGCEEAIGMIAAQASNRDLRAEVRAGRIHYAPEVGQECLAALGSCNGTGLGEGICREAFDGSAKNGENCFRHEDCSGPAYCSFALPRGVARVSARRCYSPARAARQGSNAPAKRSTVALRRVDRRPVSCLKNNPPASPSHARAIGMAGRRSFYVRTSFGAPPARAATRAQTPRANALSLLPETALVSAATTYVWTACVTLSVKRAAPSPTPKRWAPAVTARRAFFATRPRGLSATPPLANASVRATVVRARFVTRVTRVTCTRAATQASIAKARKAPRRRPVFASRF